ncbi:MAG TPA: glycosyltransferase, partial [Microthrixaceae bacterium]|nr:glycosyltransferase [Microthrixaceae bacterium]
ELLGFRPDIWPVVAAADIVVVPSVADEPFGNTAVEAVLAARPVVVSESGGLPEAIRGMTSAQQVPPGDASAIATAIDTTISSWPDVRLAAMNDASTASDRHSLSRYGDRMAEILRLVADRASAR